MLQSGELQCPASVAEQSDGREDIGANGETMSGKKILITGSEGLLGKAARGALEKAGYAVSGCDLRAAAAAEKFDFRDARKIRAALMRCDGVLHLAALSRVIWGETHPVLCRDINVGGMRMLLKTIAGTPRKLWLICASSREIYGTPPGLPCTPDAPPRPENLYARTKLAGERMIWRMRRRGFRVAVVRFSNVFGSVDDYPDRVVPAFAGAAACGGVLRVRGADSVLDFTPLSDAADAIVRVVRAVDEGAADLPPIDVVTGRATSLMELAQMAISYGGGRIAVAPPRACYPARFQGDPRPAKHYLGWTPKESLENAVGRLVDRFKTTSDAYTQNHSWLSAAL